MLWHAAAAAIAAAAAGAAGGWKLRDYQADAAELVRVQAEQRDALRRQEAAFGAAERLELDRAARRARV